MPIASLRRVALGFALSLGLAAATSTQAQAAVIYDFSLPANGDVGAVRIVLTTPYFIPPSGLVILPTDAPEVSVTSGVPLDPVESRIGVDVDSDRTLFGISLWDFAVDLVLLTEDYPDDFFVFERTPGQTGTFTSVSGFVVSDDELATRAPIATLVVSGSPDVDVPEPATMTLLGAAALGVIARRRRQ